MRVESREPRAETGESDPEREKRLRRLRCFWAMARKHRISHAKLSEIVSLELGRRVVVGTGFGLSRLPLRHLARAVEMLGRFTAVRRPRSDVQGH